MDYTPVLLVTLAIAWAAAGVYWLRTRVPAPSLTGPAFGPRPVVPRRRLGLALMSAPTQTPPRGRVVPLRDPAPSDRAGHSLVQPARAAGPARAAAPLPQRPTISSEQARLRRRNVLLGLAGLAFVTLVAAFVAGGGFILFHLLVDAVLLGYVLLLVQYQREIELERTRRLPVLGPPQQRYAATTAPGPDSHAV